MVFKYIYLKIQKTDFEELYFLRTITGVSKLGTHSIILYF